MQTTTDVQQQAAARPRRRRRRVVLAAGTGAAVVAVAVGAVLAQRGGDVTTLTVAPADVSAMCAALTPEGLTQRQVAFEGRVVQVAGGRVTLEVTRTFTGDVGDRVVLPQPETGAPSDSSAAPFERGGSYLVSADGGQVAVCGQSGPATPELTALYEQAFGA